MTKTYQVGFCRPPLEHQFSKGQSGNPSGRPKGSKNLSDVIAASLAQRVPVTIDGKRRLISKLEAAVTQITNKAAAGDRHSAKLIIELLHQSETRDDARVNGSPLSVHERRAQDQEILKAIRDRARDILPEEDDDETAG